MVFSIYLQALKAEKDIDYHLIVSGAHLDPNFGASLNEIDSDGFEIYQEVKINLDNDDLFSTAKAIGTGVVEIANVLDRLNQIFLLFM